MSEQIPSNEPGMGSNKLLDAQPPSRKGSLNVPSIPETEALLPVKMGDKEIPERQERQNSLEPKMDDDNAEDDEYEDPEMYIPTPPDGGYGWVICIASFLCNFVVDGIAYSFGALFPELVSYFDVSKAEAAWVGALLCGCYMLVGPIVSALTNRFGCRPVTMVGSLIGCIAFFVSQFVNSIDMLMLTFGVMGGIGLGLIYLPAIVSVGFYFEKKRALATGIAVCGSGVGAFSFAPFTKFLLDTYGSWKGATVILSGLVLNCMVLGSLMRPLLPRRMTDKNKPLLQRMAEEKKLQMERGSICDSSYFVVQLPDGTRERRPKYPVNTEPGVHSSFNLDQFGKGPDTPVNPLPTIAEGKVPEQNCLKPPAVAALAVSSDGPRQAPLPSGVRVANGMPKNYSTPTLEGMVRRTNTAPKGLTNGSLTKMTQSNAAVDDKGRKQSLPVGKNSSQNLLGFPNRNNNCSTEEVWVKVSNSNIGSTITVTDKNSQGQLTPHTDKKAYARPLYRKDIFYSGSIVNLPEYTQSQRDMAAYRTSVISIPRPPTVTGDQMDTRSVTTVRTNVERCCPCLPPAMTDTMSTMLDFSLLKDPVFILICASNVFAMLGFNIPFVFVVDMAMLGGLDPINANLLLSCIGITNTLGRVLFGYISDHPKVNTLFVSNICLGFSGVAVIVMPFGRDSFAIYAAICLLFGLCISAYISLTSIILVDLLGLDKLTNAFGLLILFRGLSTIIGIPMAGGLYDTLGNYRVPFFICGAMVVVASGISFMIPFTRKCMEQRARPKFSIEGGEDGAETVL